MSHPANPAEGQGELDLKEGDVVYVLLDPQEPRQIGFWKEVASMLDPSSITLLKRRWFKFS